MKYGRLLIISHTEHYVRDGQVAGWGPTVREINYLLDIFDSITHIAVLHQGEAPPSALPYTSDKIRFVPLKPSGGAGILDKLSIIQQMPEIIRIVRQELKQVDVFQFRAPTGMGVYLIPWLQANAKIPGWFKYAGNWMQEKAPLGYRLQKYWLTRSDRYKVTINGRWPGQPAHCLSFENPCLDEEERIAGVTAFQKKNFNPPYTCCFVGRLEDAKGVQRILDAAKQIGTNLIDIVHLVGDGPKRAEYEKIAQDCGANIVFHGFLNREQVGDIYTQSHFILLPSSASEGFPKVLAEAMNYGCLPISSSVSSIPHYIAHWENGFLWDVAGGDFPGFLRRCLYDISHVALAQLTDKAYQTAEAFTFGHYHSCIGNKIMCPN